jgi:hypothetical protein
MALEFSGNAGGDAVVTGRFRAPDRFRGATRGRQPGRDEDGHGLFRAMAGDDLDAAGGPADEADTQLAAALQQFYDEV